MTTIALTDLEDPHVRLPVGSPQRVRRHNRGMVLRALQREMNVSRADLARMTGLARPTVSEVVKHLLLDGIVVETGQSQENRPGKPAVMLRLDHDATQVITVDLSDPAAFRAALCTPDGRILEHVEHPAGADAVTAALAMTIQLSTAATRPLLGIGVGIPVESWSGSDGAAGIRLTEALRRTLQSETGASVHVTNAADLAALAEHRHGHGDEFLMVRLGERASTALRLGPAPDPTEGAHSTARELAHLIVDAVPDAGSPACACGRSGCIHSWVGSGALAARIAASDDGRQTRRAAAHHLGRSLAAITSALNLHRVVISGPDALVDDEFRADVADVLRATAALAAGVLIEVDASTDGADAVLRGAAAHVVGVGFGVR